MKMGAAMRAAASRLLAQGVGRVYSIGVYSGPSPLALAPMVGANPVLTYRAVTDAVATSVADPFMLRVDGRWHMFFEVVCWRGASRRGEIALATSSDGRSWDYRGIVLAEPFHLSYPHVLAWGSDHFMIPESSRAGAVRLYRADPFPMRWRFVKELVTGPVLVDSSAFHWDGRWWLLTETDPARRHDTLRLFHAASIEGPWSEHPQSPVVRGDPGRARPGGRVLALPGRLVRFAQGCLPVYGAEVRAFEITELNLRSYREVEVGNGPLLGGSGRGWNRSGMHHLDAHPSGDGQWLACVDGWAAARSPRRLVDVLRRGGRREPAGAAGEASRS